jgi:hypothetical protein
LFRFVRELLIMCQPFLIIGHVIVERVLHVVG